MHLMGDRCVNRFSVHPQEGLEGQTGSYPGDEALSYEAAQEGEW